MNNLLYGINDRPPIKKLILYSIQQVASVIVATILISSICGTPMNSSLLGAGIGTLIYQIVTKFKSPMFISSSGATAGAVIGALAIDGNYANVIVGGLIILLTYCIFAIFFKKLGIEKIQKVFPKTIIGSITCVIGINLMSFIPTYTLVNGEASSIGVLISIIIAISIAALSVYARGFVSTIPFLVVMAIGYIVSLLLSIFNIIPLIDLTALDFSSLFVMPEIVVFNANFADLKWITIIQIALLFVPVSLAAIMEHYSDTMVMSNMIGTDLTKNPGLHRTLIGDGLASFIGTMLCGLPNTTYAESTSCTAFSRVASTIVITLASTIMILMSFIQPIQVIFNTIPSCIFGGASIILYGFIALNGIKILKDVDYTVQKNVVITCIVLSLGLSGVMLFNDAFTGTSLAMIGGLIANYILTIKKF